MGTRKMFAQDVLALATVLDAVRIILNPVSSNFYVAWVDYSVDDAAYDDRKKRITGHIEAINQIGREEFCFEIKATFSGYLDPQKRIRFQRFWASGSFVEVEFEIPERPRREAKILRRFNLGDIRRPEHIDR